MKNELNCKTCSKTQNTRMPKIMVNECFLPETLKEGYNSVIIFSSGYTLYVREKITELYKALKMDSYDYCN